MDQFAESVAAADAIEIEIDDVGETPLVTHCRRGERWPLPEGAVWPVLAVMRDVRGEDTRVARDSRGGGLRHQQLRGRAG